VGADRPISLVPIFCAIHMPTAPVLGSSLASILMLRSTLKSGNRHISTLSMQTHPSFKTKTNLVERKSLMLSFSGSPSFSYFRVKTNRARAKKHYERTTTVSDSSSTSPPSRTYGS